MHPKRLIHKNKVKNSKSLKTFDITVAPPFRLRSNVKERGKTTDRTAALLSSRLKRFWPAANAS